MTETPLPAALKLLVDEHSDAARAALAHALPHLEPAAQRTALAALIEQPESPQLRAVVVQFARFDKPLRALIVEYARGLYPGFRPAITSPALSDRLSAIELIVRSRAYKLVYLLADAVRAQCPQTREQAAGAIWQMADHLLGDGGNARPRGRPHAAPAGSVSRHEQCTQLARAVGRAVLGWELHFRPEVIEAAIRLGDWVELDIRKKLQEPRTRIAHMLGELLERASHPQIAGFVLRALAIPELRAAAVRAISRTEDRAFIRALVDHTWLLADPEIERGCRRIRYARWLHDGLAELTDLDDRQAAGAVRLLGAAGGSQERKLERYQELAGLGQKAFRHAVVWQLVEERTDAASDLLSRVAGGGDDDAGQVAFRELDRRRAAAPGWRPLSPSDEASGDAQSIDSAAAAEAALEKAWRRSEARSGSQRPPASDPNVPRRGDLLMQLRAKIASSRSFDRLEALRVVRDRDLAVEMEDQLYSLAHDPDPVVRSTAVAALGALPGVTTVRILRAAVNDPDERVQANAVEALDALDVDERVGCTEPKLASSNSRVRANAVKSLLRLEIREAADVLLEMLEDPTMTHRLSALWLIERIRLRTVVQRVVELSQSDPDQRVRQRAQRVMVSLAGAVMPSLTAADVSIRGKSAFGPTEEAP